jgi:predicted RNA binding protein YcfA (HicA-like mRNA interferase family)
LCEHAKLRSWKSQGASGSFLHVPRKIRQLVADLQHAGFSRISGGKGSHRKFIHAKYPGFVLVSGHDGDDAQHYQEKQVRNALRQVQS